MAIFYTDSGSFNSLQVTGSLTVTGRVSASSFTGSFQGTASYATQALSSSYATTASYVLGTVASASYASTASYVQNAQTASYIVTAQTASYVTTSQTASYVLNAISSSFASTASYVITAQTASYVLNAISASQSTTASYALTASYVANASSFPFTGSAIITGSLNVIGSTTITGSLIVSSSNSITVIGPMTVTGSLLVSGSTTQIGNNTLTGNTLLSGSITISGNTTITGSITALNQTASFGYVSASFLDITGKQVVRGYTQYLPTSDIVPISTVGGYIYSSGSQGDLYFAQTNGVDNNVVRLRWIEGNMYSGLLNGGIITSQSSTIYQVSSGSGIIVNMSASLNDNPYPTVQYLNWSNLSASIAPFSASYDQTYVSVSSSNGTASLSSQNYPFYDGQYDTLIPIGNVLHQNNSTINGVNSIPNVAYALSQRSNVFIKAFGSLKISGFVIAPSGSSTGSLVIGSGTAYVDGANYPTDPNNPSFISDTGTTTSKIFRYYNTSSYTDNIYDTNGGVGYASLDPNHYSNNGVLTTIPGTNANWTIQRVFWFPNNTQKAIIVYYGNAYYTSEAEARANIPYEQFFEAPSTAANAIYLGALVLREGATFLNAATYTIYLGGLFRQVGGSGGGSAGGIGGVTQILAGTNVILSPTNGVGAVTVNALSTGGGNTATGSYGSFYSTLTQTNTGNPNSMSFSNTDISNGVAISGSTNTKIKITNAGLYNLQFSAQLDRSSGGTLSSADIWLSKNGTDVPYTNTALEIPGGTSNETVAAWNWFVNASDGDYYEILWDSADAGTQLRANVTPAYGPAIPSVIATVNRVDLFLSNTGSFSGSFTGTFNGTITSASYASTASYVSGSVFNNGNPALSASFAQTASYVQNAQTASYVTLAQTASYVTLAQTASYVTTAQTASYVNGSIFTNGNRALSASNALTASYVLQAVSASFATTASYVENAQTASYVILAQTASYVTLAQTASYVLSSSYAVSSSNASTASYFLEVDPVFVAKSASLATTGSNTFIGNQIINGNITVNGTASITYLDVTYESASVIYSSGSNQFGDATNDTQTLIGRVIVSGSLEVTGSTNIPSITGSLLGTASYANQALTASYIATAQTASYVLQAVSASFATTSSYITIAQTASYVTLAQTASYVLQAVSASYATTASYVTTAQTASYVTSAQTASYVLNAISSSLAQTASYVTTAQTASYILQAVSASYATTASYYGGTVTTAATASYSTNFTVASTLIIDQTLTDYATVASTIVGSNNLFTQATGSYRSAFGKYTLFKGTNARSGEFISVLNGTNVRYYDSSTTDIGNTTDIVFSSSVVGSDLQINATAGSSGWTIRMLTTYL
jgi:hypothetical protein